ncbi:MAG: SUMF1/EgtB/PvdO family nonheme iron enzyme [Pseudomonadota bacterium]
MYKVYGPRQIKNGANGNTKPGLPQKRIRLVHPASPEQPNETRAARLSWTDETDTNLDVPDFLLKQPPTVEPRYKRRHIGIGLIFVGAFALSFGGVFLFSHYFQTDAAQLLEDFSIQASQPAGTTETVLAQADPGDLGQGLGQTQQPDEAAVVAPPTSDSGTPSTATPSVASETEPEAASTSPAPSQASAPASIANVEATGATSRVGLMPKMITIEKGEYVIPAAVAGQRSGEYLPVQLETFQIASTEVTRGQWQACAADSKCSLEGFPDRYFVDNKLSLPITHITTDQMMGFIEWINTKRSPDQAPFRLPVEAEWIVAARGGSNEHISFAWGETFDPDMIRSNDRLLPVDHSEPVNGLFGMSDNAAERVAGCWITEMTNGTCFRNLGIVRGPVPGRINEKSVDLTHRASRAKNIAYENIGFRLAQ